MAKGYCKQGTASHETSGKGSEVDIALIILAAMEAYRLKTKYNGLPDCPDYDIRVCQSILAEAYGMRDRNDWTSKIQAEGLLDYGGDAKQQYKTLIERIESEVKCND